MLSCRDTEKDSRLKAVWGFARFKIMEKMKKENQSNYKKSIILINVKSLFPTIDY